MKVLAAGPWVGEFGYELCRWQASLRYLAAYYDKVIVASRRGHDYLYKDFAAQYIPVDLSSSACCGVKLYTEDKGLSPAEFFRSRGIAFTDLIEPGGVDKFLYSCLKTYKSAAEAARYAATRAKQTRAGVSPKYLTLPSKYIKFGVPDSAMKYDIVMHARSIRVAKDYRDGRRSEQQYKEMRNWPADKWRALADRLVAQGLRLCSIGSRDASIHVPGSVDLRGITLEQSASVLASSTMCIGPSSGPMHFASLCGCPHLVWTAESNRVRYETFWNPLHTPVRLVICEEWDPTVDAIFNNIREFKLLFTRRRPEPVTTKNIAKIRQQKINQIMSKQRPAVSPRVTAASSKSTSHSVAVTADDRITIGMASIFSRERGMQAVLTALLPQCDKFVVYLNDYPSGYICPLFNNPKVTVHRGPDIGPRGKFFGAAGSSGYYLTVDDDLVYPAKYVHRMVQGVQRYKRGAIITAHGSIIGYVSGGTEGKTLYAVYRHRNPVPRDLPVHMAGTGVMAYHTSMGFDWTSLGPGKIDEQVAVMMQDKGIPIICIGHPNEWVKKDKVLSATRSLCTNPSALSGAEKLRNRAWHIYMSPYWSDVN